jgi:glutathione S-transferase
LKLYGSTNSPYARKVRAVAIELGLQSRIALVDTNPRDPESGYWQSNPLGKIPALETDDGTVIYDSPVICDYLDAEHGEGRLGSSLTRSRWEVQTLVALADGTMDAGMLVRLELMRPETERSPADMDKQIATAQRGFDRLENLLAGQGDHADLGTIAACCCVTWVLFRHPEIDWLGGRPGLAAWHNLFSQRDSMRLTAPGRSLSWTGD